MSSWALLEEQFRELEPLMPRARLERQWNDASDEWRLAGMVDLAAARRFRELAQAAGALLPESQVPLPAAVSAEPDPTTRWYRALWQMTGPHEPPIVGLMSMHGKSADPVQLGRIEQPARGSADLAARCRAALSG
jgi:hypothetical protein